MPTTAQIIAIVIGSAVVLMGIYALIRLRLLFTRSGSFEAAVRVEGEQHWATGIGVFLPHRLNWFKTRAFNHQPNMTWPRDSVTIKVGKVGEDNVQVATLSSAGKQWEVAAEPVAISAIVSWIDSLPPVEEPPLF